MHQFNNEESIDSKDLDGQDFERVRQAVEEGMSPNIGIRFGGGDPFGLIQSVLYSDRNTWDQKKELVEWLFRKGGDVHQAFWDVQTHVWTNPEWMELFASNGLDPSHRFAEQTTAFHLINTNSIVFDYEEVWDKLDSIGRRNFAKEKLLRSCNILLSCGFDINARAIDDLTPLHYCLEYMDFGAERIAVYESLLDCGATLNTYRKSGDGTAPIHDIFLEKDIVRPLLELFVKRGVDIEMKTLKSGRTMLQISLHWLSTYDMAKYLIEAGANVNARNNQNETPLATLLLDSDHLELSHFRTVEKAEASAKVLEMAQLLIGRGADPRAMIGMHPENRLVDLVVNAPRLSESVRTFFRRYAL